MYFNRKKIICTSKEKSASILPLRAKRQHWGPHDISLAPFLCET